MKELVFNVRDIFNGHNQQGCLTQYEATLYHIPAYQRGYKWASTDDGAVAILMNDLWKAFQKSKKGNLKEYYLQYITVKVLKIEDKTYLEVIDGQQRLTTLSILLSVASNKLGLENPAKGKLDYAIRDNFFTDYIYPTEQLAILLEKSWEDAGRGYKDFDKQDIFYLFHATKNIDGFLTANDVELSAFYDYILQHVMLIVNSVDPHLTSESIFKNLNSNKVPLTETELIKGLLITRIGRENSKTKRTSFREITEIRKTLGRQWDEITRWSNTPEIRSFYFNRASDGLHHLLHLTAETLGLIDREITDRSNSYPLLSVFLNISNYSEVYLKLRENQQKLASWFSVNNTYNILGFVRYAKGTKFNTISYLKHLLILKTNREIDHKLLVDRDHLIDSIKDISKLNYVESKEELHRILLYLSVFIEGQDNLRFNFFNFEQQKWSLEHIFPQTPIVDSQTRRAILEIIGTEASHEVERLLEEKPEEQTEILHRALEAHPGLNGLGNMCLLERKDNSSNGNKSFDEKRINILNRLRKGSFVPKHTIDVFSKMFTDSDTANMKVWTAQDLSAHNAHISASINKIKSDL